MPDPQRKTISATQSAALYNASPYVTPWMLYHYLRGADIESTATDRMGWGVKLQPLVLEQAQADLHLDINANFSQRYIRSSAHPLGYTADAEIWCPDRGRGVVEVKCVFDYGVWARSWDAGKQPPRHHELQLQHQLTVGDGETPYAWGVIAAWVCGEMKYFERKRDDAVSVDLIERCVEMMQAVAHQREPDPFGSSAELPILAKLFPIVKGQELDLRGDPAGTKWAQLAANLKSYKDQENFFAKAAKDAREHLLVMARDNETVLLPGATLKLRTVDVREHMRTASRYTNLTVELTGEEHKQQELPDGSPV